MSASAEGTLERGIAAGAAPRLGWPQRWLIAGVMLAVVLEILDTSIVNVALPAMMGNLGATVDEIAWPVP